MRVTRSIGILTLLALLGVCAQEAQARRGEHVQERTTVRQKTENGFDRTTTWTGQNGRQATRDTTVVRDREAGVRQRESTFTGPDGQTATRETEVVRDKEAGTWTRETTATGPQGKTATTGVQGQKTEDGFERTVTRTGPEGNTTTVQDKGVWDPATKTWTRTTTKQ